MAPRVWITRTLPEAENTARRVEALGCEALVQPVLEMRRRKVEWPEAMPDALVITSVHALETLVTDGPFKRLSSVPLFVVGDALKARCVDADFTGPIFMAAESKALGAVICEQVIQGGSILYLAPRDPATPLAQTLNDSGFKAQVLTVYETVPTFPDLTKILGRGPLFVLIHSPRAGLYVGQGIANHIRGGSQEFALDVLTFICISEAAQNGLLAGLDLPTRSGVGCLIAEQPDEASLIARLKDALND